MTMGAYVISTQSVGPIETSWSLSLNRASLLTAGDFNEWRKLCKGIIIATRLTQVQVLVDRPSLMR